MRQTTLSPARFGLFLFAFTSLVAADSATQSARPDTLRSVVDEALRSNPELGAIRFNRLAIDEELTAARGLGLPTVDAKSNIGRRRDSVRTATGIKTTDDWHGSREISLSMSQRIFDGFEYKHEVWRQENRVESARWRVADTANSIALRTVQAYFEVQRAKAVLAAARSNYSALRALRSRVMSRVNAGLGDSGEATEAGSRLANAQALVIEARGRLADARALFQAVVGRGPGRLKDAPIPRRALPKNVSAAVYHARSAAPSIIATQHDTTAAEAAVGAAYSRLYPRMNLEVSSNHGKGIDEDKDRHIEHRAMLVVRWNLFNGGIDTARIREARARAGEASEIAANTRRIVERETRVSWNAMVAARGRLPSLQRRLNLVRATRSTYSSQFDTGARRLLDLLDAQSEVFIAEAALRTEEFILRFNAYRVLAAMGRLVWALNLEMPIEASEPPSPSLLASWKTVVSND
jgi:adhesin transport system outer membrane protein